MTKPTRRPAEIREFLSKDGPKVVIKDNQPPCTVYAEGGKFFVPPAQILPKLHAPLPEESRRAYQIRMTRGTTGEMNR